MVGLPPDKGFNANPALLSMLVMLITKMTSEHKEEDNEDQKDRKPVDIQWQPYVSGVG